MMLATIYLPLPQEVFERILLLLDPKSILSCKLVNREFNEIIQSSTLLQYFLACKAAGVTDNPRSPLSYGDRLKTLLKQEDAWRTLNPVFETTIKVNYKSSTYGLAGGVFFLHDDNLKDVHYCRLPSSSQDNPQWTKNQFHGPEEGILVDFDTAVYEHDLIIKFIVSGIENQADTQHPSLDLVLLKFSTGEYHPLARHSLINIPISFETRPRGKLRIVGDNFALIVQSQLCEFPDTLFIFDWKTGHKRLQHETTQSFGTNSDLVFVTPETLLVSNLNLSHFEVWHLPLSHPMSNPPVQILVLQIPAVSDDYFLSDVGFCGQPNPFLHSLPYFPLRPFYSSPENSIISANLYLESHEPNQGVTPYTFIISRRALLNTIQKWTSLLLHEPEDLQTWLTNEVTMHKSTDADDGSIKFDAQSKSISNMLHPRSSRRTFGSPIFGASPILHIPVNSGSSSTISSGSSTTQYKILQVKWADWGPSISRWLEVSDAQQVMGSAGQRYAFLSRKPHDRTKLIIRVADFNQYNFRRNMDAKVQLQRGKGKNRGGNSNNEKGKEQVEEEPERFEHNGVFLEDIYMGLKCVVYNAQDEDEDFNEVLMDEERLLGLKVNRGNVESIKLLYFG